MLRDGQTKQHQLRIYRTGSSPGAARVVYNRSGLEPLLVAWLTSDLAVAWEGAGASFVVLP